MKKSIYLLGLISLLTVVACAPATESSSSIKEEASTSEPITSELTSTSEEMSTESISIPDDIKFPQQLWRKTYTFLNPDFAYEFGFVFQFGIPQDRYSSSVRVYDYQGFVNDFNDYYYGSFHYDNEILHFTYTNQKNVDVIKMHWDGKDIYLDMYNYEYSENITYPCKGTRVVLEDEK